MPRSAAPEWRKRRSAQYDDYVRASINKSNGRFHPETGHYATLVISGCESKEEALVVRRGLFASAHWLHRNTDLECSMNAKVVKNDDGSYGVQYTVVNKDHARASVINRFGPDPENWPWSPNRFHKNYDAPMRHDKEVG